MGGGGKDQKEIQWPINNLVVCGGWIIFSLIPSGSVNFLNFTSATQKHYLLKPTN